MIESLDLLLFSLNMSFLSYIFTNFHFFLKKIIKPSAFEKTEY